MPVMVTSAPAAALLLLFSQLLAFTSLAAEFTLQIDTGTGTGSINGDVQVASYSGTVVVDLTTENDVTHGLVPKAHGEQPPELYLSILYLPFSTSFFYYFLLML